MTADTGGQWSCVLKVLSKNVNTEFYTPSCHSGLRNKNISRYLKIKKSTFTEVLKKYSSARKPDKRIQKEEVKARKKCKQRKILNWNIYLRKQNNNKKTAATYFGEFKSKVEIKHYTKETEKVERMKMEHSKVFQGILFAKSALEFELNILRLKN